MADDPLLVLAQLNASALTDAALDAAIDEADANVNTQRDRILWVRISNTYRNERNARIEWRREQNARRAFFGPVK